MLKSFKHKGLERFFTSGNFKGIPARSADRIERLLDLLDACVTPTDMNLPGFRFHELKGDRKGTYSITVTANYRITFSFKGEDATEIDLEDYH